MDTNIPPEPKTDDTMTSFPNLPDPVNGMIRTYENKERTFTRPYSAKTIFFYKEGDEYFTGVRMPVSKAKYRTMDALMDDLNDRVSMPFGVRRLVTPFGRTPVEDVTQLKHLGKYVCSSTKWARRLDFNAVARLHRVRKDENSKGVLKRGGSHDESLYSNNSVEKMYSKPNLSFIGRIDSSKQVLFVLNGKPSRIYRAMLRPLKLPTFEGLLNEISEGLQTAIHKIYDTDGKRVVSVEEVLHTVMNGGNGRYLACTRHEKPVADDVLPSAQLQLPPIPRRTQMVTQQKERLPHVGGQQPVIKSDRTKSVRMNSNSSKREGSKTSSIDSLPPLSGVPPKKKQLRFDNRAKASGVSDDKHKKGLLRRATGLSPAAVRKNNDTEAAKPSRQNMNIGSPNKKARRIKRMAEKKAMSEDEPASPRTAQAAATIQAGVRGYLVRKRLKGKQQEENAAARTIQRSAKSFLRRRKDHDKTRVKRTRFEGVPESHASDSDVDDSEAKARFAQAAQRRRSTIHFNDTADLRMLGASSLPTSAAVGDNSHLDGCAYEHSILVLQAATKAYLKFRHRAVLDRIKKRISELTPATANRAARTIQVPYREYAKRQRSQQESEIAERLQKLDSLKARRASVAIQAAFRGYRVRKMYNRPTDVDDPWFDEPGTSAISSYTPATLEKQEQSAIAIQAAYRGFRTRKEFRTKLEEEIAQMENGGTKGREKGGNKDKDENKKSKRKTKSKTRKKDKKAGEGGSVMYLVSIRTGNRWAAETDADLYIQLIGTAAESGKHWLKQSQLDPKFAQNQVDTFEVENPYLGELTQVVVGHEANGYGAGVYLERVFVTESSTDKRQYVFHCGKWLDDGQVDGKVERKLICSGYVTLPTDEDSSIDRTAPRRHELTMYTGDAKGDGGTTANLSIIGYGSYGRSDPVTLMDSELYSAGSKSVFEVDFGEIGDLYKVRVESDGSGMNPEYLLDRLELKIFADDDVDATATTMTLIGNKWLAWPTTDSTKKLKKHKTQSDKGIQPFRELPTIRLGMEPLSMMEYSGTIDVTNLRATQLREGGFLEVQLVGEFGESGVLPLAFPQTNGHSVTPPVKINFKLESVALGRIRHVNLVLPVDDDGETFMEGFAALQEIYDRQNLRVAIAAEWAIEKVVVRESRHAPYQFVFTDSRVIRTDRIGVVVKEMVLTGMEGLSTVAESAAHKRSPTKRGKSKERRDAKKDNSYEVWMTTGDPSEAGTDAVPRLTFYGDAGSFGPAPLGPERSDDDDEQQTDTFKAGSVVKLQVETGDIGKLFKVRIEMSNKEDDSASWYLKKMKIKGEATGNELRFPVEMWLDNEAVIELASVWPDIPPLPAVVYQVTVVTSTESGNDNDFAVYVNIRGVQGDTGRRQLRHATGTQADSCFKPGNADTFEIEAVSVQGVTGIDIGLCESAKDCHWCLERAQVMEMRTGVVYLFQCDKQWFTQGNGESGDNGRRFSVNNIVEVSENE